MVDSTRQMKQDNLFRKFKDWLKNGLNSKGEFGRKAGIILDELDREDFKNFAGWCAEGNYFGFYDESERDEKKVGWSADRAANELSVTTFGGVAATALGAALLPFCPFLGIMIIATGNIPRPVFNALKKYVNEETFGLLPLDRLASPTGLLSDTAHGVHESIDAQMKRFGDAVKALEESLKQQAETEKHQAERARQRQQAERPRGERQRT